MHAVPPCCDVGGVRLFVLTEDETGSKYVGVSLIGLYPYLSYVHVLEIADQEVFSIPLTEPYVGLFGDTVSDFVRSSIRSPLAGSFKTTVSEAPPSGDLVLVDRAF